MAHIIKYTYQCIDCGTTFDSSEIRYLCPRCSSKNDDKHPPKGVLKVLYNYDKIKKEETFDTLSKKDFLPLYPVFKKESFPPLKTGKTPLYKVSELANKPLPFSLYLKEDGQNPTWSFKDRASALVSAFAKEHNISTIVAASTGNAGSSLAGMCAAQRQQAIIMVPASAPKAKLTQILMYGARLIPVDGTYDDAFDLSIKASGAFGWYNRNTAFNPLTIEGKKSVSFELFNDLNGKLPDRIFVPVGDGVILSGVYKGFEDLLECGIIDTIPVVVAVQSEKSDNLVRNLETNRFISKQSTTLADSISVDIPRNFFMAKQYLKRYGGEAVTVSDEDILSASAMLSANTGIFSEPAASTAFAGLLQHYKNGKLPDNSRNVVLITGSGLKDIKTAAASLKMPEPISPTLESLKTLMR